MKQLYRLPTSEAANIWILIASQWRKRKIENRKEHVVSEGVHQVTGYRVCFSLGRVRNEGIFGTKILR